MNIRQRIERLATKPARNREPVSGDVFVARLTCILEAHRRGDPSAPRGADRAVAIMETLRRREIEETLV